MPLHTADVCLRGCVRPQVCIHTEEKAVGLELWTVDARNSYAAVSMRNLKAQVDHRQILWGQTVRTTLFPEDAEPNGAGRNELTAVLEGIALFLRMSEELLKANMDTITTLAQRTVEQDSPQN